MAPGDQTASTVRDRIKELRRVKASENRRSWRTHPDFPGVVAHVWHVSLLGVTNATWALIDGSHGLPAQAALMAVYAALAVWGYIRLGREDGPAQGQQGAQGLGG